MDESKTSCTPLKTVECGTRGTHRARSFLDYTANSGGEVDQILRFVRLSIFCAKHLMVTHAIYGIIRPSHRIICIKYSIAKINEPENLPTKFDPMIKMQG